MSRGAGKEALPFPARSLRCPAPPCCAGRRRDFAWGPGYFGALRAPVQTLVTDEVVANIDMFFTIVKLRILGELHSSLIIHADRSWRREARRRTSVFPGLPLHRKSSRCRRMSVERDSISLVSFSQRSGRIQMTSLESSVRAKYSASVVDRATMSRFQVFHETVTL